MSIADIIAIQGLLPDSDDIPIFERREPFKFGSKADEQAALAEADSILDRLREKHGDDQRTVTDEFHEILEEDERLQAAVIKATCRLMCEELDRASAKQRRKSRRAGR